MSLPIYNDAINVIFSDFSSRSLSRSDERLRAQPAAVRNVGGVQMGFDPIHGAFSSVLMDTGGTTENAA